MDNIHPTTRIVFVYLRDTIAEHGIPPNIRQISDAAYIGRSTVYRHLDRLEAWGWIEREPGMARGIRLTQRGRDASI